MEVISLTNNISDFWLGNLYHIQINVTPKVSTIKKVGQVASPGCSVSFADMCH